MITDSKGKEIKIGTRVQVDGDHGTVDQITDWDDAGPDDYGRSMPIPGQVHVVFDSGVDDFYTYRWEFHEDDPVCDDVEVLTSGN